MSCCFRFDKRGEEEGHDGERVGVESGEGDDEREGHSLGDVGGEGEDNSPMRHRPKLQIHDQPFCPAGSLGSHLPTGAILRMWMFP